MWWRRWNEEANLDGEEEYHWNICIYIKYLHNWLPDYIWWLCTKTVVTIESFFFSLVQYKYGILNTVMQWHVLILSFTFWLRAQQHSRLARSEKQQCEKRNKNRRNTVREDLDRATVQWKRNVCTWNWFGFCVLKASPFFTFYLLLEIE